MKIEGKNVGHGAPSLVPVITAVCILHYHLLQQPLHHDLYVVRQSGDVPQGGHRRIPA